MVYPKRQGSHGSKKDSTDTKKNNQEKPTRSWADMAEEEEKDEKKTFSKPKVMPKPARQPPKPANLSKQGSPLSNDPLWLDSAVVDGDAGYVLEGGVFNFSPSFDSFLPLCDATYNNVISADKEFARFVSPSMYQAYNVTHLYARQAAILEHRGNADMDDQDLIRYIKSNEYPVHEPINAYLRGIGDFDDPAGKNYRFTPPAIPTNEVVGQYSGFFGRIDEQTHALYEAAPSPGVCMQRIHQDLRYTTGDIAVRDWSVPDGIAPILTPAVPATHDRPATAATYVTSPTRNLLGWAYANMLTKEQRQTLEQCGFTNREVVIDRRKYCLNIGLFEYVANRVRTSSAKFKTASSLHEHLFGSVAQVPYLEVDPDVELTNRNKFYCEDTIRSCSRYQLDARISVASRWTGFRINKQTHTNNEHHNVNPWACFYFNNYQDVPAAWTLSRNAIFDRGRVNDINHPIYYTAYTLKDRLRTPFITSSVVKKSSM